jgi:hypothetical protein
MKTTIKALAFDAMTKNRKATMAMATPTGQCGGSECGNTPTVAIGALRLCDGCLEKARLSFPKSFAAYWQPKITRLVEP